MKCPNCNVALVMADRQGIEIDYCPQCRGIWLDRGELDKIIERSTPHMKEHPQQMRDDHYNQEAYHKQYKHHKPKNWLSELFD